MCFVLCALLSGGIEEGSLVRRVLVLPAIEQRMPFFPGTRLGSFGVPGCENKREHGGDATRLLISDNKLDV